MQPATFPTVFRGNPKIITHTGQKPPYGYVDWWPISLYVNNEVKPFDDKDVRWALRYYIDRQQLIEVGYLGASQVSSLPMPRLSAAAALLRCGEGPAGEVRHAGVRPEEGRRAAVGQGLQEGRRLWTDAAGQAADAGHHRLRRVGPAIGPVLSELLKRRGVEASFSLPPDFDDRFQKGQFTGSIYGHGGAINEPYSTLRLYQGASVAVPGAHLVNFARWKNAEFDKITDEMYVTDPNNKPKMMELFHRAMEIWLPELPDIQLVQNFHRIPMNTTYWKNWPTAENAYVNGASWHLTYPIVLWNLQPA